MKFAILFLLISIVCTGESALKRSKAVHVPKSTHQNCDVTKYDHYLKEPMTFADLDVDTCIDPTKQLNVPHKPYDCLPDQIIGTSLKRACQKKGACDRQGIPTILNELMEKIVIQRGTLRASGNVGNVDKIVTGINKNQKLKNILKEIDAAKIDKTASYGTKILAKMFGYFNSPTYAIHTHTLANTLKRIFSTMHPSLIPYYLDKVILEHSEEHSGDAECFYRAILNRLEPSNYNTLKKLIVFLKKVVEQSEMDDNGVATCIANSILHSPPLVVADTEIWEGSHRSPAGSSESLHDSAGSARHVRRPKSNPSTGSTPGIPHEQNTAIHYITFVEYLIVHYKSVFDMYKY